MSKRRANGEGSIRKRADGRWEGRYTAGHNPETGKQIFKNVLGKTQAEVKQKLKDAIAKCERLDFIRSESITVGEWLDTWHENFVRTTMRPSTIANYETLIRVHIKPHLGSVKLRDLSPLMLQKLYAKLMRSGRVDRPEAKNQSKGLSAKTIRNIHTVIFSACEKAIVERLLIGNPAHGCQLPPKEHREMKTIPPEKIGVFLDEARKSGVLEMYCFELATGLRRGELFGLKWSDIDFSTGSIFIQRQVQRIEGKVVETSLKTKNAYRSVMVSKEILDMLTQMRERTVAKSEYVFPSPTGGILEPGSQRKLLQRVLKRAGLEEIRFHDLRHTFAMLALQNGVDVKTLSGMLGHYSTAFTLDVYGHVSAQMQADAAQKMGGFISEIANPWHMD